MTVPLGAFTLPAEPSLEDSIPVPGPASEVLRDGTHFEVIHLLVCRIDGSRLDPGRGGVHRLVGPSTGGTTLGPVPMLLLTTPRWAIDPRRSWRWSQRYHVAKPMSTNGTTNPCW